jgi:uncharacterized protein YjbI with pentapeptide repeats
MAKAEDVDLVRNAPASLLKRVEDRARPPLDLTEADFSGLQLQDRHLVGADLSRADFHGSTLHNVRLDGGRLVGADLRGAVLSNVNLDGADLESANFSPFNGKATIFQRCSFVRARFEGANLQRVEFVECQLHSADFYKADLSGADVRSTETRGALFRGTNLSGAKLRRIGLQRVDFSYANLNGADFLESNVEGAIFTGSINLHTAQNLSTVMQNPYNFDECHRGFVERWIDWERIRTFGRLPLFGASYTALLAIIVYLAALEFYNERVDIVRGWADKVETAGERLPDRASDAVTHLAEVVRDKVHPQPPPAQSWLILISTVLLAAASTIYVLGCPEEIKEYSRVQWCYELNRPLVHYWPRSWTRRWLRVVCAVFYAVGGLLGAWVIFWKVVWVISYLSGFGRH